MQMTKKSKVIELLYKQIKDDISKEVIGNKSQYHTTAIVMVNN